MSTYLAFDLGASSGRAILGTLSEGRLTLQEIHRFNNGPVTRGGELFWEYGRLVGELKTGLRKAIAVTPDLAGIGIDSWGVDYVFFKNGSREKVRDPYNYRDARGGRGRALAEKKLAASELYKLTGIQHLDLNTIYQLTAHHAEHPEDFVDTRFLMMPDALALALGGDFSSEYTDCSTTNLLDPAKRCWHEPLLKQLGLPRDVFPPIASPCTPGGVLSKELQQELSCGPIPIWKVGSHDTASAVAAVPAPVGRSWAYLSAGTWDLLGAELDNPVVSAAAERASFTNEIGLDGKIRFLTNIMGSWLFQEFRRVRGEEGVSRSFGEMEELALTAKPLQCFIDPNDAGFAAPCDMPRKICDFCRRTGQPVPGDDAAILRTIYDSLAFSIAGKLRELERLLNVRYESLNVVGGGTKAALLMQLIADAFNAPVTAGPVEATAIGNLLAQAIAAGELKNLAAAREAVRASFDVVTYRPEAASAAAFAAKQAAFDRIVPC